MQTITSIVVGSKGEVGAALLKVLSKSHKVEGVDLQDADLLKGNRFDILHICFPFSDKFVEEVKKYQGYYSPTYTIIHSTVPIGTSKLCNSLHSPVIGMHPFLEESLKVFTKFIGGEQASEVADYFRRANMKVYLFDKPEVTEYLKLRCTEKYGIDIEHTKDVKREGDKLDIPFAAWTLWVEDYNRGYKELGHPEFTRPNLIPIMKKIGGHCILPNAYLLESKFSKFLKLLNQNDS